MTDETKSVGADVSSGKIPDHIKEADIALALRYVHEHHLLFEDMLDQFGRRWFLELAGIQEITLLGASVIARVPCSYDAMILEVAEHEWHNDIDEFTRVNYAEIIQEFELKPEMREL